MDVICEGPPRAKERKESESLSISVSHEIRPVAEEEEELQFLVAKSVVANLCMCR